MKAIGSQHLDEVTAIAFSHYYKTQVFALDRNCYMRARRLPVECPPGHDPIRRDINVADKRGARHLHYSWRISEPVIAYPGVNRLALSNGSADPDRKPVISVMPKSADKVPAIIVGSRENAEVFALDQNRHTRARIASVERPPRDGSVAHDIQMAIKPASPPPGQGECVPCHLCIPSKVRRRRPANPERTRPASRETGKRSRRVLKALPHIILTGALRKAVAAAHA